jgi:hypothetical protein
MTGWLANIVGGLPSARLVKIDRVLLKRRSSTELRSIGFFPFAHPSQNRA